MVETILNYIAYMNEYLQHFIKTQNVWGFSLAVIFGAICIICFWPALIKKPWHWAVMVASALITMFFTLTAEFYLTKIINPAMLDFWGSETLNDWLLITVIPTCLFIGLVQAGATLVSVVIYWWRKGMNIDYKLGLTLGAVAGGGFGILEAWLTHDTIFARGWTWNLVRMSGVEAFAPFLVQFFVVALSTAASALAGYGLAKGKGWQAYIIVSVLHAALIYGTAVLAQSKSLSLIFVILFALVVTGIALWLRWRKTDLKS